MIYLDHAAATPLDSDVLAAMQPYFAAQFYNPSALYGAARQVKAAIAEARRTVAGALGGKPAEIIFTAGATEANNLAISGVMRRYPQARLLMSAIEHDAVLAAGRQYDHDVIPVTPQGIVSAEAVRTAIDDNTVLVSVMYANNEIGTIQPIREIGRLLGEVRRERRARGIALPIYLHTDAAQAANYLDLSVARLGVDLLSLNGSKIYGPKQSGALYVRAGIELTPLVYGGGQERGLRSGTENVAGIVGLAAALDKAVRLRTDEVQRLTGLRDGFVRQMQAKLPDALINGSLSKRLPNNVHMTLPGADSERLIYELDARGIMAAAGSACSAASGTPSHVLAAIGVSDDEARGSLRLTFGRQTDQTALDRTLAAVVEVGSSL